ncbi:MAG: hypothetical protein K2N70_05380, partial [Helicobacter sp.]|nr:hypothetical protein [Helicobacter sp.]
LDKDNKRIFQVIVYKHDIWELFRSLCKIFYYGHDDNNLRLHDWTQRAVFRNVLMSCNFVAISCFKLFETLGIKSRVVGLYENGNVHCGHSANEVFVDGRWILMDFTKKIVVQDKEGNPMSLRNVIDKGGFGQCVLQPICNEPVGVDSGNGTFVAPNGYFFNISFEVVFLSLSYPKNLKAYFDSFDVYLCSDNPVYEQYVLKGDDDDYNRKLEEFYTERRYYKFLSYQDFMHKFYSEVGL